MLVGIKHVLLECLCNALLPLRQLYLAHNLFFQFFSTGKYYQTFSILYLLFHNSTQSTYYLPRGGTLQPRDTPKSYRAQFKAEPYLPS